MLPTSGMRGNGGLLGKPPAPLSSKSALHFSWLGVGLCAQKERPLCTLRTQTEKLRCGYFPGLGGDKAALPCFSQTADGLLHGVLRVGPCRLRELSPCSGVSQSPGTVGLSKTCLSSLCHVYLWYHSGLLALCTSAPCWAGVGVPSPKKNRGRLCI